MKKPCNCCCANNKLDLPNGKNSIHPGSIVVLGRFSTVRWKVGYGWFKFGGNRAICGWSLTQVNDPTQVKPIQETDLYDIYLIQN